MSHKQYKSFVFVVIVRKVMHYELLLVDDERPVTRSLERVLRKEFSVVHQAQSGEEALKILDNNNIDVVISDYCMPSMDGADLVSEIHRRYPDILNLMLSGQADMEGFSRALNDGAISKFLCKPWNNDTLKQQISNIIKEHESTLIYDKLTKLPTLKLFSQEIAHISSDNSTSACIALVNMCEFSKINVQYGTQVGNKILKTIANRLTLLFPDRIIARIENDKFAVLLQKEANIAEESKSIVRALTMPVEVKSKLVAIKGVIGITSIEDWKSNQASNFAKNIQQINQLTTDINPVVFCNSEFHDIWFKNAFFVNELQAAIQYNQLTLQYQPQVNYSNQKVVGCEALLRWQHPTKGSISPDQFIPLIERYGLENDLIVMILDQVFNYMSKSPELFEQITMSINLFASQIGNPDLTQLIIDKMKYYCISPSWLELEITETTFVNNYKQAREQLHILRALGIKIAIDDFGTGYASYECLCELPIDVVKIDGRFIRTQFQSLEAATALNAIIATAKTLELDIVAECIETEHQANLLTGLGCYRLQGFLFSKALNWNDFVDYTLLFNSADVQQGKAEE